ncbi:MAG: efflux RND transporter periplasmic adaptor subunit [Planctomycetota bacterium]
MLNRKIFRQLAQTAVVTALVICPAYGQNTDRTEPITFPESSAAHHSIPRMMPGLAVASQSADLAVTVSQQLAEIHASEGQFVKSGALLATLENGVARAEYEAALAIAQDTSAVEAARIDVDAAKRKLERIQEAAASGASNPVEVRAVQNDHLKARAALQIEESRLTRAIKIAETARCRLEAFNVRAPFDGIVTRCFIGVGNMVAPGEPVFSMIAADTLRIELNLPIEFFGRLQQGESYELSGGAPVSKTFRAELEFVSPAIDAATQSFRCVFVVDNGQQDLPSGFPAQLSPRQARQLLHRIRTDAAEVSQRAPAHAVNR